MTKAARWGNEGFTLTELATVLLIVAILITMLVPAFASMQARAEKVKCITNLKSVSIATNLYVQDKGNWPQIDPNLITTRREEYSQQWIDALRPYKISPINWICPSVQKAMGSPDIEKPENARVDYIAMPFDSNRFTPFRWPNHPWFIERGAAHGNGSLIIFANGSIRESNEYSAK